MREILKDSKPLARLLERNRVWAARMREENPAFFSALAEQQAPRIFWIGCSDSRVPSTQIVDVQPGEIFVHRNVANVVDHTDLNCLSAMQFAVETLQVEYIIVCGHYGCGGVGAALRGDRLGLIDNWLQHVQDVRRAHDAQLAALPDEAQRLDRLCELNVLTQAARVCQTTIVRDAWLRGQNLQVHGWIYGLSNGHIRDLDFGVSAADAIEKNLQRAAAALFASAGK